MQIKKLTFSKSDLALIDEKERNFFIGAAHISNELNVLSKLFQWALVRPKNEIERRIMVTQGLMLGRILNGKLYEGWKYLEKAFFGPKISKVYEPLLSPLATEALEELKVYFSSSNTIGTVRNKFSFHYDPTHFGAGYDGLDDDVSLEILLGEQNANTIFAFSDDIVGQGLVDAIDPADRSKAMESFMTETSRVSGLFSVFLGECMRIVLSKYKLIDRAADFDTVTLSGLPEWADIRLPFFTQSPSHFSYKMKSGESLKWGEHSVAAPQLFKK